MSFTKKLKKNNLFEVFILNVSEHNTQCPEMFLNFTMVFICFCCILVFLRIWCTAEGMVPSQVLATNSMYRDARYFPNYKCFRKSVYLASTSQFISDDTNIYNFIMNLQELRVCCGTDMNLNICSMMIEGYCSQWRLVKVKSPIA